VSNDTPQPESSPSVPQRGGPRGAALDPYRDWLGIMTPERPPSPYQLLGLGELETSQKVVAEAARATKKTVRAYQIGQYRAEALALMTEIGQAADLLTNHEKKAAYDGQRRRRLLDLAKANFPQAELSRPLDEVFAEWLGQCDKAGLPVSRLLPDLMKWCLERPFAWPARGSLGAPLPVGLWVYLDAAVVGQCVAPGPLEARVRAVKQLQALLGVSVPLSRIINLDIVRRPDSFAETDVVRMAADQPRALMQAWIDRLAVAGRGKGVALDTDSPAYRAMALLLGFVDENGSPIDEPVRPQTIEADRPSALAEMAAGLSDRAAAVLDSFRRWAGGQPQLAMALKIALAIAGGVILLILLLLLLAGN
jgi:hypothetical protein